jgi:hypothetical protein
MVHQGENIRGELWDSDLVLGTERDGLAVSSAVQSDHPDAGGWSEQGKGLGHFGPESVLEEEWQACAGFTVVKG